MWMYMVVYLHVSPVINGQATSGWTLPLIYCQLWWAPPWVTLHRISFHKLWLERSVCNVWVQFFFFVWTWVQRVSSFVSKKCNQLVTCFHSCFLSGCFTPNLHCHLGHTYQGCILSSLSVIMHSLQCRLFAQTKSDCYIIIHMTFFRYKMT